MCLSDQNNDIVLLKYEYNKYLYVNTLDKVIFSFPFVLLDTVNKKTNDICDPGQVNQQFSA